MKEHMLNQLIAAAQQAVEESDDDAFIRMLEVYSAAFDDWSGSGGLSALSEEERRAKERELKDLALLHARVLERAGRLKDNVASQLRSLKKKGKGILAYTDVLPKRVSSIIPRKY